MVFVSTELIFDLIDVASNLDGDKIEIYLKETGSPALIKDPSDYDSIYVIMPMKG